MKKLTKLKEGAVLGAAAWAVYRVRKYPLEKGYFPASFLLLPRKAVSSSFASFGNRQLRKMKLPLPPEGIRRYSFWIASKDEKSVRLTVYEPVHKKNGAPCLVYFHGGGFCFADAGYIHRNVAEYARNAECKVIFVHYRTSDRYGFPTPFEDCCSGLQYVWENSSLLGIDRDRLAVGGDSAGGALAAACTLWARDETEIRIAFQMLLYPVTDARMHTVSMTKYTDSPVWNARLNERMWKLYLRNANFGEGEQTSDAGYPIWYASPMEAKDFSGLPKAYIEAEEFDCLHDEGLAYGEALRKAGVEVQTEDVKGTFHGFDLFFRAKKTRKMMQLRCQALRKAFALSSEMKETWE